MIAANSKSAERLRSKSSIDKIMRRDDIVKTVSDAIESISAVFPSFGSKDFFSVSGFECFIPALNELFNSFRFHFISQDEDFLDPKNETISKVLKILNYIESVCSERGQNFYQALIYVFSTGVLLKRGSACTPPDVLNFYAAHLYRINTAFAETVRFLSTLNKNPNVKNGSNLFNPACLYLVANSNYSIDSILEELRKILGATPMPDVEACRTFTIADAEIVPAELASIRPVEKFYGYPGAREFFKKYFQAFSEKAENIPLLITSLPGLGKTHFTISHALVHKNLFLVLGQPYYLQDGLVSILARLKKDADKLFVLFFDDIDARKVDWFHFRTNVGGAFILPKNVTIVIASNYEFPPNILSRGRGFSFPIFDEIRCQEMVHDFLLSLGMRNPSKELISVIAADYVEEFGQHVFEELSPRTLVRYLDRYMDNPEKRKRMLALSKEKVVPIPDASCFLEANRKLIEKFCEERK